MKFFLTSKHLACHLLFLLSYLSLFYSSGLLWPASLVLIFHTFNLFSPRWHVLLPIHVCLSVKYETVNCRNARFSWREDNYCMAPMTPGDTELFAALPSPGTKGGESKSLGMRKSWLSLRKFLGKHIIFNKNLLSWTLLLARMWDAEFSLRTKQNRRSQKALFARCRLEVPARHTLTQSTGHSHQETT